MVMVSRTPEAPSSGQEPTTPQMPASQYFCSCGRLRGRKESAVFCGELELEADEVLPRADADRNVPEHAICQSDSVCRAGRESKSCDDLNRLARKASFRDLVHPLNERHDVRSLFVKLDVPGYTFEDVVLFVCELTKVFLIEDFSVELEFHTLDIIKTRLDTVRRRNDGDAGFLPFQTCQFGLLSIAIVDDENALTNLGVEDDGVDGIEKLDLASEELDTAC